MRILHSESKQVIASKVVASSTFYSRAMGLMFMSKMDGFDGMLFEPGNSMHTCFMKFPIDIIFLNRKNEIVAIKKSMKPWRMTRIYFSSVKAIELKGGTLDSSIVKGMKLEVEYV